MNRADIAERLAERNGTHSSREFPEQKPRLPEWLFSKIMEQCHGQPSERLMAWLEGHQHTRDDISRWHMEISSPHWQDPDSVLRAGMSLADHPMRNYLGRMLSALVNRHSPRNQGCLPPEFVTEL